MNKIKLFVIAILIIIGLLLINFYISFGYGSFAGFIAEQRNLPEEEKLESLRHTALEQLTQTHSELNSLTGLTLYEKTHSDMCAKGDHSWKRNDPYAYICSYRLTYYYGTDREYKSLLLDLEKTLENSGWKIQIRSPEQPTISESVSTHSGEFLLAELPVYEKKMPDGNITLTINGFNGYGGYWTKSNEEPTPFGFGIGILHEIYKNVSDKSPEEIFNKITSTGQDAIMFAISREYFRN